MSDANDHPAERIEALEASIEALRDKVARSRRLVAVGRIAAVAGPLLLVALMVGLVAYSPARVLTALAALIGGVVLMGSSRSSTAEFERALALAVRERDAAIDSLGLVAAAPPPERGRVIAFRTPER